MIAPLYTWLPLPSMPRAGWCMRTRAGWWIVEPADDEGATDFQAYMILGCDDPREGIDLGSMYDASIEYRDTAEDARAAIERYVAAERAEWIALGGVP